MIHPQAPRAAVFTHFHLFSGAGGGAKGFNKAASRVGGVEATWRCLGGVDVDPDAVRLFGRAAGVPGTALDLFDREQYTAFHGREPPRSWKEATPDDIRKAAGNERPNVIFLSPPCKGSSSLLSESKAKSPKYTSLNKLGLRGVWLSLEAWKDDPAELVLLENVPRVAVRARRFLDELTALLRAYGYAVAETEHDCGELGGLAQSRRRFLLVARHAAKVRPFLYEPPKLRLRGVGEILGRMPLPGDPLAGPMHRVPALQWSTWVRLAFVEAGKDWRSLSGLEVVDGKLRDYLLVQAGRNGRFGVNAWNGHAGTVAGQSLPTNGAFRVADPRFGASPLWRDGQQYGVTRWEQPSHTIAGQQAPGQGRYAVCDPRPPADGKDEEADYAIVPAGAAGGASGAGAKPEDPRAHGGAWGKGKYNAARFDGPARTVIANSGTGQGAFAVADPRPGYGSATHQSVLRVQDWTGPCRTVTGQNGPSAGAMSVADPRPDAFPGAAADRCAQRLPDPGKRLVARIRALDGTWHRPFTTLELAALQSYVDPGEALDMGGITDTRAREHIGNLVPPDAAKAVAETMGRTLLLAMAGEGFALSSVPIWVRPVAVALSIDGT